MTFGHKDYNAPAGVHALASDDFYGALVYISSDTPGFTGGVGSVAWTAAIDNTAWDPRDGGPTQRFWLGPSYTFATSDVNTTNDTITKTAHGRLNGEGPFYLSSSNTLPGGSAALTKYWFNVVDANTYRLSTSRANALANVYVNLTTQGVGTHTNNCGSGIVIPAGGITRVCVRGNVRTETDLTDYLTALIAKNGATYYGMPEGYTYDYAVNLCSASIPVVEGDIFHLNEEGGSAHTIDAGEKATWMSIEVVTPRRVP